MRPSLINGHWLSGMNHRWNFSLSSRTKGLSIWQFLSRLPFSWDAYEFDSSTAFLLEVSARWAGAMLRVAGLYSLLKLVLGLLVSKEASYTNLGWTEFSSSQEQPPHIDYIHQVLTSLLRSMPLSGLFTNGELCDVMSFSHIVLSSACSHSHVFMKACYCALTTISNTSWVLLDFWMDSIASVSN